MVENVTAVAPLSCGVDTVRLKERSVAPGRGPIHARYARRLMPTHQARAVPLPIFGQDRLQSWIFCEQRPLRSGLNI